MLKNLIFRKVNRAQLGILSLGAFVGFLFLLSVVHYLGEIMNLTNGQETLGSNLVVAQKKVTKYSAFDETSTLFETEELDRLRAHPAIKKMEPVVNNQFYVSLAMREEGLPYFSTDIFIQAVSNDLLDVQAEDWTWDENAALVPLIMPRDFMLMLNQFAASYKIPQVSEDIAKTLNFTLEIRGKGQKKSVRARIVGFSNQMNSVLVPMSFMDYGNSQYAAQEQMPVSQLVIQMDERNYAGFEKIMEELNLEIKENELLVVKIQGMLYVVLGALFFIALIIIGLCGLLILQFSMLLLSESAYEIQTLLRLGYHPKQLSRLFFMYFLKRFAWIILLTLPAFFLMKYGIDQAMMQYGLVVSPWPSVLGIALLLALGFGITFGNYLAVTKKMYRML
jgi:hypothetical protein